MRYYVFASAENAPDFVSSSVMRGIDADYSHVGIILTNRSLVNYEQKIYDSGPAPEKPFSLIYHSTGEGVNVKTADLFFETHKCIHLIEITKFVKRDEYAIGWLDSKIGLEYSESQYVGFFSSLFKRFVNNNQSKFICSELVAEFLNHCSSLRYFERIDCDFVDPKQLIEGLLECIKKETA